MFLALALLLAMEIVNGSKEAPPNIKDFNVVLSKELEFRIDDYKTAFVGRVIVYQNPEDPSEFVRVYYRQVAVVSERAKEKNTTGSDSRDSNLSNLKYHSKQETEMLGRVQQSTDAFIFIQWHAVRDSRTGQDIRNGPFRLWFLEPNGNWIFSSDYPLLTSLFSEPSKTNPKKRIPVGIKFSLVSGVHIVRIDQDDILTSSKDEAR